MSLREIKSYPDPVLRKKAAPIEEIDGEIMRLTDDMIETMHAAPGVGLAAPQIGVSLQVIVIDISVGEDPDSLMVLINPEIVSRSGKIVLEEGCLSLPGVASEVPRYEKVAVRAKDQHGKPVEIEAEGLLARALQHEIDHLSGSLYWDRIGKIKREHLRKKYKKSLHSTES